MKYERKTSNLSMSWEFRQLPFWERVKALTVVSDNGCHVFIGCKNDDGYARIHKDKKLVFVHRAVYELHNGWIPKGMVIMHKCDNPACINPEHLMLGTQAMNIKDMDAKNRRNTLIGSQQASSKLTEKDIPMIRQRLENNESCASISKDYAVSEALIRHIKKQRIWKHVA